VTDDSTRDSESSSIAGLLRQLVETPNATLPPQLLASGTVVDGRFRIDRLLGQGGTAIVYVAHDLEAKRDVALKVGNAESEAGVRRVRREAQALAKLEHPSVIRVYAVGGVDERMYIAMELVGGGNARAWLANPRTWREVVRFYAAAGDGLAAAHAAGFVHRDVKPDNILVGANGTPRVADFGLVAARDAMPSTAFVALTRAGAIMGTPAYMAPEQLAGEVVDARADQFSLCAAIWEALFGEPPFPGATMASIAAKLITGPAKPPADTRGVPPRIVDALCRGLALAKADRWPSVAELVRELRRGARRRWPYAAAIAAAAVVAGIVAFAVTPSRSHPAPAQPTGDRLRWRVADGDLVGHGRPLHFDPARAELRPFLEWALVEVRSHVPDAELARIEIENVRRDGTADLTLPGRLHAIPAQIELRFASKHARAGRADCMQHIHATATEVVLDLEFSVCDEEIVPIPRCTPSLVWYLLANRYSLPKDALVNESYYEGFGAAWFVDSAGRHERFADACD
jgi:Protein kinase domain